MKKGYKKIIAGSVFIIVGCIALVVISRKPDEIKTVIGDDVDKTITSPKKVVVETTTVLVDETDYAGPPPPPIANTLKLVEWINENIGLYEKEVLIALSELDPFEWRPVLITPVLVKHFAAKGDIFAAIDTLEIMRGSKGDFLHRETVAYLLAEHSAKEEPTKLMSFLDEKQNSEISLRARHEVGARMIDGKKDRGSVIELIQSRPADTMRNSYLEGALGRWGVEDLDSLTKYLAEAKNSPDLDRGYEIASNYTKNTAPHEALQWAMMINDVDRRYEAAVYAARELVGNSPDDYSEWFNGLKDAELKKVLEEQVQE